MQIEIGRLTIRPVHIILGAVALSALLVLVLLLVMLPSNSADTESTEQVDEEVFGWATADRLVAPEDFSQLEFEWVPYRGRRTTWTEEQVFEYWNDPDTVGIEVLGQMLEAEVRTLLEEAR